MHKKNFIFLVGLIVHTMAPAAPPDRPISEDEVKRRLIAAVKKADYNQVVKLTTQYKIAEFCDDQGVTPLMHLFMSNPVKDYPRLGVSALDQHLYASEQKRVIQNVSFITAKLLDCKANPNARHPQTGNTVLMLAALSGHKMSVFLLLKQKAKPHETNVEELNVFALVENKKNDARSIHEDKLYNEIEDLLLPYQKAAK